MLVFTPPPQGPFAALGLIASVRHRRSFERFRPEGRRVVAGPLWVVFVADPSVQPPQVAFAFGRALGSAVHRNRVRRRLRAILAARSEALAPGLYLVGGGAPLRGLASSRLDGLVGDALAKLGSGLRP